MSSCHVQTQDPAPGVAALAVVTAPFKGAEHIGTDVRGPWVSLGLGDLEVFSVFVFPSPALSNIQTKTPPQWEARISMGWRFTREGPGPTSRP